ncbi:MAG: proprotein convertase P-domain-containing protein [Phycisphaerales bacterium]
MKLSLCLTMAAGLAAAAAPALGQQVTYFNSGRTYTLNNGGTIVFVGFSAGNIGAGLEERWAAQPFTIGAGGAQIGEIQAEGFIPGGSEIQNVKFIIWSRAAGNPAPVAADQLFTGTVPLPPVIQDPRIGGVAGNFRMILSSPINLAQGDYYLTVYGGDPVAPGGTSNFAWFANAQFDPDHWTPPNTPLFLSDASGSYMWRANNFSTGGFLVYRPTAITVHPQTPTPPTSGPGSTGHSIPAQNPDYLWTAAFRIMSSPPLAACCLPDGTCITSHDQGCALLNGVYQGHTSTCGSITCPQPGACCNADGTCQILPGIQCTGAGQIYQGDNTTCPNANCTDTGACCQLDGTCALVNAATCQASNGLYRGAGSACGSANCPSGYPYLGSPIFIQDATGQNGTFCGAESIAEITVADSFTIAAADVSMFITHQWQGDLVFTLTHVPSNTSVEFYNRVPFESGGSFDADNFGASPAPGDLYRVIDSAANFYRSPPAPANGIPNVRGHWKPDVSLAAFAGLNSAGVWRLRVKDCGGPGDIGNLEHWHLSLHRPGPAVCYANCDNSTQAPVLNVADFGCFLTRYASGDPYANCDASTQPPVLNVADFGCFLTKYAAGCP